jgi:hypothetical protein
VFAGTAISATKLLVNDQQPVQAAVAGELTGVADGAITANDPVSLLTTGKFQKSGEITIAGDFTSYSDVQVSTSNTEDSSCAADPHNSNRWAFVYGFDVSGASRAARLRIVTRSGSTVTTSSEFLETTSTNTGRYYKVIWDVNRPNRVIIAGTGHGSVSSVSVITIGGTAGNETFTRTVDRQQVGNDIPYNDSDDDMDTQLKHLGTTGDNYLWVYHYNGSTSRYHIFSVEAGSVTARVQHSTFWNDSSSNASHFDIDPGGNYGVALLSKSNYWWMKTFEVTNPNATNVGLSFANEQYVISSGSSYRVADGRSGTVNYVGPGQFVVSHCTHNSAGHGGSHQRKAIYKVIKWDNNSTFTKSSSYFHRPAEVTAINSSPERSHFCLKNHKENPTILYALTSWNTNPSYYMYGYRVVVDVDANSLTFSTATSSNVVRGSWWATDIQNDSDSTMLWYREIHGSNSSYRLLKGGGPGNTLDSFIGFATSTVSDGNNVTVKTVGNIATQSGLTPGLAYYVQSNGTIGTIPATPSVKAGVAISATSILVK